MDANNKSPIRVVSERDNEHLDPRSTWSIFSGLGIVSVEESDPDSIKFIDINPKSRTDEDNRERLYLSIKEIGIVYPPLVDVNDVAIEGNGRILTAKRLKREGDPRFNRIKILRVRTSNEHTNVLYSQLNTAGTAFSASHKTEANIRAHLKGDDCPFRGVPQKTLNILRKYYSESELSSLINTWDLPPSLIRKIQHVTNLVVAETAKPEKSVFKIAMKWTKKHSQHRAVDEYLRSNRRASTKGRKLADCIERDVPLGNE